MKDIVERVRSVIGPGPAGLHEPDIGPRERESVSWCLDSGWVSHSSPMVQEFETRLAAYVGRKHCIATCSGTAALELVMTVLRRHGVGDALIPAMTFVATANAAVRAGISIVFEDCDEHLTLSVRAIDPASQSGDTVCVPVDVLGFPCEWAVLEKACASGHLVEDASQALGARIGDRKCGSFGLASILSFNGNKIVTCGGGGAILTDDQGFADEVRRLASQAKVGEDHTEIATNRRMPAINAALGIAQLERIDEFLRKKRMLAEAYQKVIPTVRTTVLGNNWLIPMTFDTEAELIEANAALNAAGYQSRRLWKPIHKLTAYSAAFAGLNFPNAERAYATTLCLPSSPKLLRS